MKSLLNALQEGRLVELPETDKAKALEYLAHLIEAVPDLGVRPELAEMMIAREKAQNTGIGLGVACPHVRTDGEGELLCSLGWSPQGIEYGSSDGKKVHLVAMYYIPVSQKGAYLKEVSSLVASVRREGWIQEIANAADIASVRERLLDWVSNSIDQSAPDTKARMIRLEAKQAEAFAASSASPAVAEGRPLSVATVLILIVADKAFALSEKNDLVAALESDRSLKEMVLQKQPFSKAGYSLTFRSVTHYGERSLYEYLAVKPV